MTTVMAFLKCLPRHDVQRADAQLDQVHHRRAGLQAIFLFAGDTAAWAELFGRLIPIASIALAIVFAVVHPAARTRSRNVASC